MSWQAYVDQSLVGSGNVQMAVIMGADGSSVWATSPGFTVAKDEIQVIISSFSDTGEPKKVTASGFKVAGKKYMTIRSENAVLVGKKGREGVICALTKQALIIACHGEDIMTPNASNTVESLASYLIGLGY